jgi:hypothetical protein
MFLNCGWIVAESDTSDTGLYPIPSTVPVAVAPTCAPREKALITIPRSGSRNVSLELESWPFPVAFQTMFTWKGKTSVNTPSSTGTMVVSVAELTSEAISRVLSTVSSSPLKRMVSVQAYRLTTTSTVRTVVVRPAGKAFSS